VWDGILAVLVAMVLAFLIATTPGGARAPDAVAYLFAAGIGAMMLLRRRLPRTVLVLTTLATFAYYTFDYPQIGVAVPLVAALLSAAEVGLLRWPIVTALVVYGVSTFFRIRDGVEPLGTLLGYESVSNLALSAAAIAIGYTIHARRIATGQRARIAELTDDQLRRETDLQVRGERTRISRELHDTIGHTLSIIALHAGVADEAIGHDDDSARAAVARIRAASRESLTELRSMVRLLRESGDGPDELASLAAVESLVAAARSTGLAVDAHVTASSDALSPTVDAAAYRVVQEALTNVIRHAHATRATVTAEIADGRLRVVVADDGAGPHAAMDAGAGLKGMDERVRLLRGTLRAQHAAGGGFVVEASMPVRLDA
jgi:signal transduction histidine kinase